MGYDDVQFKSTHAKLHGVTSKETKILKVEVLQFSHLHIHILNYKICKNTNIHY